MRDFNSFIKKSKSILKDVDVHNNCVLCTIEVSKLIGIHGNDRFELLLRVLSILNQYISEIDNILLVRQSISEQIYFIYLSDSEIDEKSFRESVVYHLNEFNRYIKAFIQVNVDLTVGGFLLDDKNIKRAIVGANLAKREARKHRKNTPILFKANDIDAKFNHLDKEYELEIALENKEYCFYLQPQYDLKTGEVVAAEALARRIKDQDILPPSDFIDILTENELIKNLDYFILEEVCIFLRMLKESGRKLFPISVNLSRLHTYDKTTSTKLLNIVNRYDIDPKYITFEFTEDVFLSDFNGVSSLSQVLRENGFKISIDDFGSGYTSLSIWLNFRFDEVKIDKIFISSVDNSYEISKSIIKSVVDLANKMGVKVVCEGVETEKQVECLKDLDCLVAQGFYFSHPVTKELFLSKYC